MPSQKLQQHYYLENIYFYSSKLSNNNVFFFNALLHIVELNVLHEHFTW